MLRVTPIYGSRWSPDGQAEQPSCTLVEYGGCRVLWNVGWWSSSSGSASSSSSSQQQQSQQPCSSFPDLPDHDCLVLTDSTLQAVGGLPQYYKQMKEKQRHQHERKKKETERTDMIGGDTATAAATDAQNSSSSIRMPTMYATFPTVQMGQMSLYDDHASISLDGGKPPYTLEDVDDAFAALTCIKYSQAVAIAIDGADNNNTSSNSKELTVTAHRAGRVVGGCFYVLQRLKDDTSVVLTSNYHIAKELHLESSTLLRYGSSPDVLVTHPGGPAFRRVRGLAHPSAGGGRKGNPPLAPMLVTQAERNLVDSVLSGLRRDGNVLLPVDASGRVLELVLLLHKTWQRQRLFNSYHLVWLAPLVTNTAEFARAQLEWMHASLGHQFDAAPHAEGHPYALAGLQKLSHPRELAQLLENSDRPTCVVASGLSLDGGPARDVLLKWASDPDNAVVFTDSSQCYLRSSNMLAADITDATMDTTGDDTPAAGAPTADGVNSLSGEEGPQPVQQQFEDSNIENDVDVDVSSSAAAQTPAAASRWTAAAQLLLAWSQAKYEGREMDDSVVIDVPVPVRHPLRGAELKAYLDKQERLRQEELRERERLAMLREVELAKGQLRLGEQATATAQTSTAVSQQQETTGTTASGDAATKAAGTTPAPSRPRKKSRFDSSLFLKFSKPLHLTFEVREEAVGLGQADSTSKYGIGESVGRSGEVLEDDYGIAVLPEKFTDIVSGVDPSKFTGGSGRIGEEVLRRGLGYGVDGDSKKSRKSRAGTGGGGMAAATGASRVSEDEDQDDMDDELVDEQAIEALDLSEGNGIIRGRNGRSPTKVTTVLRKLEVLAEISFVPLEGRVDARAARQSVRALQPRQVVVLGGPREDANGESSDMDDPTMVDEVTLLSKAAFSFATDKKPVQVPSDGETAELDVGHAAYAVRLIDAPYQTLEEKESLKEPPLPVEPYEEKLGACTVSLLDAVATGQKVALDGSIVLAPRESSNDDTPKIYLSDGEVLLTDLRAELIAAGMKAEYSAHVGYSQLVVNGKIVVKKPSDSGEIGLEGPLCEDFYTVRTVVCGQFVAL